MVGLQASQHSGTSLHLQVYSIIIITIITTIIIIIIHCHNYIGVLQPWCQCSLQACQYCVTIRSACWQCCMAVMHRQVCAMTATHAGR